MSRPSDWSVVGWDHDPTPGDPVVIRAGGEHYLQVAETIDRAARTLRALNAGGSSGSESVTALLEDTSELAERLETAAVRYQVAGDALVDYAFTLDRIQAETAQALVVAKAARAEADECRRLARLYRKLADEATDPDEKTRYERLESTKVVEEHDAEARVSAQRQVMGQGATDQMIAGNDAAARIEQVTSTDGLNDSWKDDFLAALSIFATIMETISTILGILALILCWVPVVGQALMVLAAIAGIITALANIVLAASGEISWTEAIISIGFAVLGCVGLGGLRGAMTALKAGGKLLTSSKALTGAFKAGARGLKVVVVNLAALTKNLKVVRLAVKGTRMPSKKVCLLTVGEQQFVGVSGLITRDACCTPLGEALDQIPVQKRADWHGKCAEIHAIDQAFRSGITDFSGSVVETIDVATGAWAFPCKSCKPVLKYFGISYGRLA